MTSTTTPAPAETGPLADLERRFVLDDRERVLNYLARHRHLVPLLADIADQIPRFFRPVDHVLLQIIEDADTDVEHLYAIVRTSLTPDESEAALDRFDEDWWLDAVERARNGLTVDAKAR